MILIKIISKKQSESIGLTENSPVKKAYELLLKAKQDNVALNVDEINLIVSVLLTNKDSFQQGFISEGIENQGDQETKDWIAETFLQTKIVKNPDSFSSINENESQERIRSIRSATFSKDHVVVNSVVKIMTLPLETIDASRSQFALPQSDSETSAELSEYRKPMSRRSSIGTGRMDGIMRSNPDPENGPRMEASAHNLKYSLSLRAIKELDHLKIHQYLESNFHLWSFDMYELEQMTNGHALYFSGLFAFQRFSVVEKFELSFQTLQNWLLVIEREYFPNSYHNSIHGADVLHAMCYLALENPVVRPYLTEREIFACLVAALGHDIDHPGVNNAFLVKTHNKMALLYNDVSVNENHHASHIFFMTKENVATDIFKHLSPDVYEEMRKLIVRLVLATDMAKHFQILNQFKSKCEAKSLDNPEIPETRYTLLEMSIKCADLNNPSKPAHISKKWVDNVMEEFFIQGDYERSLALPISQFMDRYNVNIPKCQVGFIDFLVLPLFEAWVLYNEPGTPDDRFKILIQELQTNRSMWALIDTQQTVPQSPQLSKRPSINKRSMSSVNSNNSSKQSHPAQIYKPKLSPNNTISRPELSPARSNNNIYSVSVRKLLVGGERTSSSEKIFVERVKSTKESNLTGPSIQAETDTSQGSKSIIQNDESK